MILYYSATKFFLFDIFVTNKTSFFAFILKIMFSGPIFIAKFTDFYFKMAATDGSDCLIEYANIHFVFTNFDSDVEN